MNTQDIRLRDISTHFLHFMKSKVHAIVPSSPLTPENDPTTLFTGSGMQPMLPYLLGQPHPAGDYELGRLPAVAQYWERQFVVSEHP